MKFEGLDCRNKAYVTFLLNGEPMLLIIVVVVVVALQLTAEGLLLKL